ncbi:MAG: beta-ketoacyl-[acyl-carrier-protein] synthase II, partial [Spirochaetia bacterium]|nr:beta-ketoacyl-[acyl-carrier-protein] synthase II [Spirochaetia bacterium]
SGAAPVTRFDASGFKTRFACEVKGFDPLSHFDRKEARHLDLFVQYGLVAAQEAVAHSAVDFEKVNRARCGVIFSSGIGGFQTFENEMEFFLKGDRKPRFNPYFITKIIANGLAGALSIRYGLKGINTCPVTACASSNQALVDAFNQVRWGKADLIIAGGAEAPITPVGIGGFNAMKALSVNNDQYATASRPFDKTRDGFVVGEGAAALVVESLDHALERGALILGEILGGGQAADAYHITSTHPEGEGAFLAIRESIEEAQVPVSEIGYLNAHATSTGPGDLSEIKALKRVFGDHLSGLAVSATKSMTGHLLGAAGALEAIIALLAVRDGIIPPTINTRDLDESIPADFHLVREKALSRELKYALNNSFGFGGHCAALLLGKYSEGSD